MRQRILATIVAALATAPAAADIQFSLGSGGLKAKHTELDINFKIGGRIQLDYNNVQTDIDDNETTTTNDLFIRRARIAFSGNVQNWGFKAQYNIAEAGVKGGTVEDLFIEYTGFGKPARITLGKQKEGFGLEELESSKDITFLERGPLTDQFAPGRNYGLQIDGDFDWGHYQFGVFENDSTGVDPNKSLDRPSFTGRIVYNPIKSKTAVVHIGGAYSNRANDVQLTGFELGTSVDAFHAQAEYVHRSSKDTVSGDTDNQEGYYVQAGYILTGEHRPYKGGAFKRVKPTGEFGAWEVAMRYDSGYGDFGNLGLVEGGRGELVTGGVNWYANNNVKLGLNVGWAQEQDSDNQGLETRFRTQFVW
ncbi:Porin P [BD1-7 clade bacterium]|uniref:Porin P n=1 Tax=BD1-7 clade bacterium TaxID=2029982 RepID=A0A5S9QV02_9GAMM|nr:Porin P [BD1-7 clade bacterium]